MLAEKELLLKEIVERVNPEMGFIIASYQNLGANAMAEFREKLVESGGEFFVLKKRVLAKAAKELNLDFDPTSFEGHVGLVSIQDNFVNATKALFSYKKEKDNVIEVLGGHFEGKSCSSKEIEAISKLPSQDEMRAQMLGLLEAPMANVLGTFNAIMTSVINCLDNKAKK